jgi:hypothetical protein
MQGENVLKDELGGITMFPIDVPLIVKAHYLIAFRKQTLGPTP